MKVGDLVRLKSMINHQGIELYNKTGLVSEISEPTPIRPYQVVTVILDNIMCDGIPTRMLEVISE